MSAIFFLVAVVIFGASALGANISHALYWGLTATAAGLLWGALGLPGFPTIGNRQP